MDSIALAFPPMPAGADKTVLKPSAAFNQKVYYSIAAILLFVFCYLVLFASAVGIAVVFGALGVGLMSLKLHWLTLVLGLGLIGSGLMLIFFVIKFLFKRTQDDRSDLVEISAEDQPQLFAFIDQITREAHAPAPKKIYLSADVNAGVFYDSSFWSMFLPVKKNLKIGLGLVNCVNVSEFKAIMAHEFGHFSQRSMKFGSYVYNLNKVIYNMLYDNDGYEQALTTLASGHSILRFLAYINIQIIKGMQFVLRKVYIVLNKNYMGLSREMEFHADAVAAYASGSNQMITSLKRVEIGQICYDRLLGYWNGKLGENKLSANIYPQQQELIRFYATSLNVDTDAAGLPVIADDMVTAGKSEIVVEDQWSSHPSTEDREAALNKLNLQTATQTQSAWVLFNNAAELQERLTDHLYAGVTKTDASAFVQLDEFKNEFYENAELRVLDKRYKGYYDDRNITAFAPEELIPAGAPSAEVSFDNLFDDQNTSLPRAVERMATDIGLLDTIANEASGIKTFDYKGNKYKRKSAADIKAIIEAERTEAINAMEALDKQIFIYFYKMAGRDTLREELVHSYRKLFTCQEKATADYEQYNDIMQVFSAVYQTMPYQQIEETLDVVYEKEKGVKLRMQEVIADENISRLIPADELADLNTYLSSPQTYFADSNYDEQAIGIFNRATSAYIAAVSRYHFGLKKVLLNFQLSIAEKTVAL